MNDFAVNFKVPDGYVVDQDESTKGRIVLKRMVSYPKSWDEFVSKNPISGVEYYIDRDSIVKEFGYTLDRTWTDKNLCKTDEEAEAFLALIQLKRVWHEYADGYKGDYFNYHICSLSTLNGIEWLISESEEYNIFSVPSKELAQNFLNNFKDLFKKIEPLFKDPK